MRIYLSVPMVANREQVRARVMAKAIVDSGNEVSSPWVLGSLEAHDPSVLNIFHRDRLGVEGSDAIVADVSQPSIGVGMEVMAAYYSGKKVIVVMKKGSVVSRMLLHMDRKVSVEFDGDGDLYSGLRKALETPL